MGTLNFSNVPEQDIEEAKKVAGRGYGGADGAVLLRIWHTAGGGLFVPVLETNVVPDPPVGEGPRGVSPAGSTADGSHGHQASAGRDMYVPTHWSGAGNGETRGNRGIYHPPPEHGRAIHCDPSYHRLVFGGGADSGNAPIQDMV